MTQILAIFKFIFDLRGMLSGYKTYIALSATILMLMANMITNSVIPWMDGTLDTIAFMKSLPESVGMITAAYAAGTMRSAIK